uniref:Uncharacterized protein n=1 Tax=Oryza glumipatula TaxID=40148 RepID=A0A0D9ZK36_9ORYZ
MFSEPWGWRRTVGRINNGGVKFEVVKRYERRWRINNASYKRQGRQAIRLYLTIIQANYGKNQGALEERLGDGQCHHGHSNQDGGLIHIKFKSTSDSRSGPH